MVVVLTHISTSFHQISPSFFHLRLAPNSPEEKEDHPSPCQLKAYIEKPNSISSFANKVIGSLPVLARKRIGNKCTPPQDSRAFYEFQQRRGKENLCMCYCVAAVGAGLLKSEEILQGVTRVSISNDLEQQNFIALMTEARLRRAKLNVAAPTIPMELRVEKALEGMYACCFRRGVIEEEDEELLQVMLTAVFPSVEKSEIERIIREKATRGIAEGGEEENLMSEKRLPEEAIQMQMKDPEFFQQQNIES